MSERRDVYAYFWIQGFDDPPEDISTLMAVTPSRVERVGESRWFGALATMNRWELLSPLNRGEHLLQDYLEALLPILEARASVVRSLASLYSAGINCVGYFYGSNPGLHLSASLIKRLAELELAVDFDLYNCGEESAAST